MYRPHHDFEIGLAVVSATRFWSTHHLSDLPTFDPKTEKQMSSCFRGSF